jgi:hypothetical protein
MARKQGYNLEIVENVIVVHAKLIIHQRACGVVGSASALQAEGHRFDSGLVHSFLNFNSPTFFLVDSMMNVAK